MWNVQYFKCDNIVSEVSTSIVFFLCVSAHPPVLQQVEYLPELLFTQNNEYVCCFARIELFDIDDKNIK